jgi:hypothetical protein
MRSVQTGNISKEFKRNLTCYSLGFDVEDAVNRPNIENYIQQEKKFMGHLHNLPKYLDGHLKKY